MVEGLDNSTRAQWDGTRTKTVTWSVPNDWPSGDYIVRAFGNATYPCHNGARREHCDFALEDRETFHLHQLAANQGCPSSSSASSIKPSSSSPSSANGAPTTALSPPKGAPPGISADNYNKSSLNLLSKNLAGEKLNFPSTTATSDNNSSSSDTNDLIQSSIDQSATQRIQDQTILKVLDELRDYNLQMSTLTLLTSGRVIPMADRMDSSTIARFVQTIELTNSAIHSQTGNSFGSLDLVAALHKNNSLIVTPPQNPTSTTTTTTRPSATMVAPFNHTEVNPFGRGFVQQHDQNQIQDKSNDVSCIASMRSTTRGLFVAALTAVIGTLIL
ncbi:hypothetical protein BGZ95_008315 [Linnemannia exigua]|uniref:Uncharacterized protein n=1 Tax=Linnemannia exigua TaxID=604196 RepID=A0AAD4H7F0_9FUNG|nr:hypothetical protein BGZ95_008315 [Linnemannia exigua]